MIRELTSGKYYDDVCKKFSDTCSKKILKVEIIQNTELWGIYKLGIQQTVINRKKPNNQQTLWHGTSKTNPKDIYNGEEGFDMKYSHKGMWGRGVYFARNAKYSDTYAYNID